MAVNLFIDTNIFLSFYHFTGEDLEELNKLAVLLEKKQVQLLLPDQVRDEFNRNREVKISAALKGLKEQHLNLQFPQLCKDYDEYEELRRLQKMYQVASSSLLEKLIADVEAVNLKADLLIQNLFGLAKSLPSPKFVDAARLRMDIGNPPGKDSSLGDGINWETLLAKAPNSEDLHFVTDDRDYSSPLDPEEFLPFLSNEYLKTKKARLHYYKRLSQFFSSQFPHIHLASEIEKDLLIDQLANSGSFAVTHRVVAQLRQFSEFSVSQSTAILTAVVSNSQVGWVAGDPDVRALLQSVITTRGAQLEPSLVETVEKGMKRGE